MKTDYKNTLNLPTTAFPMKANLPQKEPERLAKWQSMDWYRLAREKSKGRKKYILHLGPPYANGDIHIGHAVTTILKDMVVKSKMLSGYDAPLVPGWDCHGLPIEVNVEKKIGLANVDVPPKVFREKCREYAESQIALQKASFIRLGILADWDNPYKTMDFAYEADIVRSIGDILKQGHLQRGAKPVHWCTQCGSALAEAEVEYQNKTSPAIDVCFRIHDLEALSSALNLSSLPIKNAALVIWTTTPWTLPANQAVTLHPDLDYVLVKGKFANDVEAICVLEALLENCMARYECQDYEVLAAFKGRQLEKHALEHPFYDRLVPVIVGEHVTVDAGTGAVHTAPAHGLEDYQISMQYGLKIETEVDSRGCFFAETPIVGGMHVFKANDKVIEVLREKNNLLHATTLNHSYPHCWRHKTPLIFRATAQWFISMQAKGLRQNAIREIEKVKWVPEWGASRIQLMVQDRPDWCISRQRTWGTPLPFVLHKQTGTLHPQMQEIIEIVAKGIEQQGIEAWHELDINTLPFSDIAQYEKSQDTLDVWFDSGVSHTAVLKKRPELQFPADLYLEGSDQHRGWFQSSLLSSVAMMNEASYRTVLTHGFTVDAQGRKMSKSLGNVVAPDKVLKTLGADILRLWVSATDYKGEIHVSDEILNRTADAYRRIRNTMRFLLANLDGFSPKEHLVQAQQLVALDAWIIDMAAQLQQEIISAYDSFQFHLIYQKVHNFCVVELGSFYLDVIKDRQYTTKRHGLPRRSAQTAMYYLAHCLTRWLAPILSFTAEEIWEVLPDADEASVFLTQWREDMPRLAKPHAMDNDFWHSIMFVRDQVNKALEAQRAAGKIGAPLDAEVFLYAQGELLTKLQSLKDELRFILITSDAVVKPLQEKSELATQTESEDLWVWVKLSEHEKCVRCWHHREDVNQSTEFPEICGRCVENITQESTGEIRHYA
ncbi:isoleucine--tRNA ligase [Candidatus Berkiella aquae]|nr:isoleucine--tRNA ligase [Candidatus Berkiella aquae]MCS5712501.1 isoleucine--tRNA ligase [Candidatus Berkiella aquae]